MIAIDRSISPKIYSTTSLEIPDVKKIPLSNGIDIYCVNLGTQELVQVEFLFRGGRFIEKKMGTAKAAFRILKEGTKNYSGKSIAESIDFYGANIMTGASLDYSFAKIFTLKKHFSSVFPILEEVILKPQFAEAELAKYKKTSKEKLKVEMAKTELVAYRKITEDLFGKSHPYGYNSTPDIYDDLTINDLQDFHKLNNENSKWSVVISGKLDDEIINTVVDSLSNLHINTKTITNTPDTENIPQQKKILVPNQLQSALKIGKRMFNRHHSDFYDMFILNTILGGYFGSRLMNSLREEKGYTYNIYSSIDMLIWDGYFQVSTEVGNEYLDDTIDGIFLEIGKLKQDLVGEEELSMVKNYLSGNFLNMIDGPFKVAGMTKILALNDLKFDFYTGLMDRIHSISSHDLLNIAQKYLSRDSLHQIVVGS